MTPSLRLTPRETEVLELRNTGLSNADIGRALNISQGTVKIHVKHILDKGFMKKRSKLKRPVIDGVEVLKVLLAPLNHLEMLQQVRKMFNDVGSGDDIVWAKMLIEVYE